MSHDSMDMLQISVLLTVDHQVIGRASHVADSVTCFTLIMSVIIEI